MAKLRKGLQCKNGGGFDQHGTGSRKCATGVKAVSFKRSATHKGGRGYQGGRKFRGKIADMAAGGANMARSGGKRQRPAHEEGQNKAASGEVAGVSAPCPLPGADSPLRSEDETADGTMATNSHYPLPRINRSKRQCVRERDLAWNLPQEGKMIVVAKQFVRKDGDGESAWTPSPPADEDHASCPSTGKQETQKNEALAWTQQEQKQVQEKEEEEQQQRQQQQQQGRGDHKFSSEGGLNAAKFLHARAQEEASSGRSLPQQQRQQQEQHSDGESAWTPSPPADEDQAGCPSTGNQGMQKNEALAWTQQEQKQVQEKEEEEQQQRQQQQQQGRGDHQFSSEEGLFAGKSLHARAQDETMISPPQHQMQMGCEGKMGELQQAQDKAGQSLLAEQKEATRQQLEEQRQLMQFLALESKKEQVLHDRMSRGEDEQSKFSAETREQMRLYGQRTGVLEQAVGVLQAPGVMDCHYAGKLEGTQQELASAFKRTEAMQLQLEGSLVRQRVEGQELLGRASRGEEEQKTFTGEIREQLRCGEQQTEGLKTAVQWLQERSYTQDVLEQSVAAASSEIVDVWKVLHGAESMIQTNLSEFRGEVAQGLRAQKQEAELLATAGRELQVGTVQGFERLAEALQHEQARREEGAWNMHGALEVAARRQQLDMEAQATGLAQHKHLLRGFEGAVSSLQIKGAAQEAALAAALKGCEEQTLLVHALTAHVQDADATMAKLSNRAQAAEREARGADGRAEQLTESLDDAFFQLTRRLDRHANSIATNNESCARVEQGLANLRQEAGVDTNALGGMARPVQSRGAPRAHHLLAALRSAYRRGEKRGWRATEKATNPAKECAPANAKAQGVKAATTPCKVEEGATLKGASSASSMEGGSVKREEGATLKGASSASSMEGGSVKIGRASCRERV